MKSIVLISLFFTLSLPGYAQIVINEACSQNKTILLDEFGESSDWLELYNAGNTTVDLHNYHLSDELAQPQKWTFPAISLPANAYLLIFASELENANQALHANFKLSKDGETISLYDPQGALVDRLVVPALNEDVSFGHQPDASGQLHYFFEPSPNTSNNTSPGLDFLPPPIFLETKVFHEQAFSLALQCPLNDCEIRYTTDGTLPDGNDDLYTAPLLIDSTLCIRARAYSNNLLPSTVASKTYFYQASHSLPIVALTTDPYNLWDWEEGIFMDGPEADTVFPYYGANYWRGTEIPMVMEYFKDRKLVAQFDLGSKIHGGKAARTKPMKALRLIADKQFGAEEMDYPFFDNKPITSFKRLVLRNASGDYNFTHFRDAYIQRYAIDEGLHLDVLAYQPVAVYINGRYWGLMNLREKVDAYYLRENHGVEVDEVDILEEATYIVEGDFEAFDAMLAFVTTEDMRVSEQFEKASSYFDIKNIADYFIVQTIVNNTDWPENNIKYWRERKDGASWRYLLFDMDVGMGRHGWTRAYGNSFGTRMELHSENNLVRILTALLQNPGYHQYFINRYADLLNDSFREERLLEETEKTAAEVEEEIKRHFEVWGWPGYEVWKNDRLESLYAFIEDRPPFARQYVMEHFNLEGEVKLTLNTYPENAGRILVNTIEAKDMPWEGYYFQGLPVKLTVLPNEGYTFSHWQSLNTITTANPNTAIEVAFSADDAISAIFDGPDAEPSARLYPNPVDQTLRVELQTAGFEELTYSLYDALGKKLQSAVKKALVPGRQSFSIPVEKLDVGMYWLRLETASFSESLKFIKQGAKN